MSIRAKFQALLVLAIAAIFFAWSQHEPVAAQSPPSPGMASSLKTKLLVVRMKPNSEMVFIQNATTNVLGDRTFLAGTNTTIRELTTDKFGFGDREIWLPVNDIQSIVVFENKAQIEGHFGIVPQSAKPK
jgi:hypothetical protein